jgi:CBS domain-containing protein
MITARFVKPTSPAFLVTPDASLPLAENAPASSLMTDFAIRAPATVFADRHIGAALNDMILAGVRALIVVENGQVIGLITAYDILGEKPIKFLQSPMCRGNPCTRDEIVVGDIMTQLGSLETLELSWLLQSTAKDLAAVFASKACTHMFVMEAGNQGSVRSIRALISRTQIERHLGTVSRFSLGGMDIAAMNG